MLVHKMKVAKVNSNKLVKPSTGIFLLVSLD